MRILILQLVPPTTAAVLPKFCHSLGVAAALLKAEGFDVSLAALDGYRPEAVRQAVTLHRPTQVLMDMPATRLTAARHIIADLAEKHALGVYVVGDYATACPEQAISTPGVVAIVAGHYERAAARLFASIRDGLEAQPSHVPEGEEPDRLDLPGVWYNSEEGLVKNPPDTAAAGADHLPWPDRELFQFSQAVGSGGVCEFAASRGCGGWCGFCLNDAYIDLHGEENCIFRRNVADLVGEIQAVRQQYKGVKRVNFTDHGFAADAAWLAEFAGQYSQAVKLPFRCHVRLGSVDDNLARLLASAGCKDVHVEIGSGSSFIRDEVLSIHLSNRQILSAVSMLRLAGLRIHAGVFVGCPYETDVTLEETMELLARLRPDAVRPRVFYPIPGTTAEELCRENGWISGRGEENFLAGRSVLDCPSMPAERINRVSRQFGSLLKRRNWRAWLSRLYKLGMSPIGGK